jgi:hypothetical protein
MRLKEIGHNILPPSPPLKKLFGPSFILLGMGLGSGELILWPYLSANYGMGIIWAAVIGITFQFFINMEIERYTLVTGESVFVGLARKFKILSPLWFILSTLIPWMWPGIILSSATVLGKIIGFNNYSILAIGMLIIIGTILTLGKIVYKTQEFIQKSLIFIGVPIILCLSLLFIDWGEWPTILNGFIGRGSDFWFIPAGLPIITFLGAFAYAGAGGNLNLAQSFYIKEKKYGMGKYSGKITSLLTGEKEELTLEGKTFEINNNNIAIFKEWWKKINLEHLIVFWFTGALTIILLSLLAFFTVYENTGTLTGISFLFEEALVIGRTTLPFIGTIFLIIAGLMLFSTQLSIMDATSRIMSENLVIIDQDKFKIKNLVKYYYGFLWIQIFFSILILSMGFNEPLQLVIIGAFLNAITMFVYSSAILWLNTNSLPRVLRPKSYRVTILLIVIAFFGFFSLMTFLDIL